MKRVIFSLILSAVLIPAAARPGELHIVTTGDVHGTYFNRSYIDGQPGRNSLMSVKHYVDSLRAAVGKDNVILLDCGDFIQGDNASYYFNYVATGEPHIMPRLVSYMGYDACTLGNHDIETGHPVYDRIATEMQKAGIPWLAGNAIKPDGGSYFQEYTVLRKAGRKILVMGYDNPNMDEWLAEDVFSGMRFENLIPLVQQRVDKLRAQIRPDAVIVLVHSGTGKGDGSVLENQGLDLFKTLRGVDVLVCAHDHNPACFTRPECVLVNGGARSANVGHAVLRFKCRKVVERTAETVRMDRRRVDEAMVAAFDRDWQVVRDFTITKVGTLTMPLLSREAYAGMCSYIDFLQTVQMKAGGADISLAAPLSFNSVVKAGDVVFNDMFKIYPFENQLFVLELTGREIRNLLEFSYNRWIVTPGDHILNIREGSDARTGAVRWSFVERSYNFDAAAGINYTVDVTKPFGSRVCILSLADGRPFDPDGRYKVAMTSYRANGGGALLTSGAGIPREEIPGRVVAKYPEIREFVYGFIKEHGVVDPSLISDRSFLGSWEFVPQTVAAPLLVKDMSLMF
ncbi:MAG: bifunctional metallophosphatase/5'-nucleotidase [Bacteroidales bacterium]|nr:bifunctional metallophosphatase/5'-nucleotidase [Bacteroidales bacterium]